MEFIQEYFFQAIHLYHDADPYLNPIRRFIYEVQSQTYPIILPYLNRAAVFAQDSPAIISVGLLLLFLLIAVQILSWIRRFMMWWFRLCMRILFWSAVVVLVSVVWQRGVGRTVEDLVGWGEELRVVWWREYRRWEGYQNMGAGDGHMRGKTNAKASWR
ncbi:hypothetical protein G7Y89_g14731 [Cudoniella acicularis]|uniref:Uncharacterized protein n=1 Tax=Cudoniella acicularis TaxID=354080 RepID=A0A8H4QYU3_9HELO|nr:hypothetical protein G7Y89_g14731 [Cudoniella acicularis]